MSLHRQRGVTTIEFAIVGVVLMAVLIGVIEFGRAIYTYNMLSEAARRGARVAAICPVNHSMIRRVALFGQPGDSGPSSMILNLDESNIALSYLDQDGAVIANPQGSFGSIRYVRVAITDYQHPMLIPFADITLSAPGFAATLPRESLGIPREGVAPVCFGSQS